MIPLWGIASRRVKRTVKTAEVPYLAMASVFSLMAMMFVLPIPGGTTGHISGTTIIAILLGPWSAIIAASVALIIQAVVMGDGGITAIGANCFNIAVVGALTGAGVYRLILKAGGTSSSCAPLKVRAVAAAAASYAAVNLGALSAAVQLGLQPLIYGGEGTTYFPFPLQAAIPAITVPHLTAIGALEATITVLVLTFLHKKEAKMKSIYKATLLLVVLAITAETASAHDYWIEKKDSVYAVVYGHRGERLEYDPGTIKKITVLNAEGKNIEFIKETQGNALLIRPAGNASVILADLESGYWSKTIYGLRNVPKRKASRVIESFRAYHYSKSIVSWSEFAQKPIERMKLDLVPQKNPLELRAGDMLPVKVFREGAPLPGATVEGDHDKIGVTGKDGIIKVAVKKGRQLITVEHKEPLKGDPDADFITITTTLTFEVGK